MTGEEEEGEVIVSGNDVMTTIGPTRYVTLMDSYL